MKYVKLAYAENYDSLYLKVETAIKRYVNVEEYYYPILIGDIIWSYFQDRFGYTHYLIFTGDNGSGKNSALLFFKLLGTEYFMSFLQLSLTIGLLMEVRKRGRFRYRLNTKRMHIGEEAKNQCPEIRLSIWW